MPSRPRRRGLGCDGAWASRPSRRLHGAPARHTLSARSAPHRARRRSKVNTAVRTGTRLLPSVILWRSTFASFEDFSAISLRPRGDSGEFSSGFAGRAHGTRRDRCALVRAGKRTHRRDRGDRREGVGGSRDRSIEGRALTAEIAESAERASGHRGSRGSGKGLHRGDRGERREGIGASREKDSPQRSRRAPRGHRGIGGSGDRERDSPQRSRRPQRGHRGIGGSGDQEKDSPQRSRRAPRRHRGIKGKGLTAVIAESAERASRHRGIGGSGDQEMDFTAEIAESAERASRHRGIGG